MSGVRAHVIYGNPQTGEWENVAAFDIEVDPPIDWSVAISPHDDRLKAKWHATTLPNGELLEVHVIPHDSGCTVNVRQCMEPIAQVLGAGRLPSVVFRTLAGQTVNIQIHDR